MSLIAFQLVNQPMKESRMNSGRAGQGSTVIQGIEFHFVLSGSILRMLCAFCGSTILLTGRIMPDE